MRKSLDILIKLHKKELDSKRQELANLITQRDYLQLTLEKLKTELIGEQELILVNNDLSYAYSNYAERVLVRQDRIGNEICSLNESITKLSQEVFELFVEGKKYKIIQDNKRKATYITSERAVARELDEMAITKYVRRERNDPA